MTINIKTTVFRSEELIISKHILTKHIYLPRSWTRDLLLLHSSRRPHSLCAGRVWRRWDRSHLTSHRAALEWPPLRSRPTTPCLISSCDSSSSIPASASPTAPRPRPVSSSPPRICAAAIRRCRLGQNQTLKLRKASAEVI